jgi:hypothetical protein
MRASERALAMFTYVKLFLAVMFAWLLYATLVELTASMNSLIRQGKIVFMDDRLGERVLVVGKDSRKIGLFLLQHLLITAVFATAVFMTVHFI